MALHIVFVEPEIPQNSGNISRTCAATGAHLHLVEPLGFSIEEKAIRRAGLDYWKYLNLTVHKSLDDFLASYGDHRMFLSTTKGVNLYSDIEYKDEDMFLFGAETRGLPTDFICKNLEKTIRIPMSKDTRARSLNLSNSANIVLFEALRQLDFPELL